MKQYYQERLALLSIQDQILAIGSEILISNLVDQAGHIDFEKLSTILKAYENAKNKINSDREFAEEQIRLQDELDERLEKINNEEYNKEGGEKNDSESL